jgi:hypothetical protein
MPKNVPVPKNRRRPGRERDRPSSAAPSLSRWVVLLPALVAVVLNLPGLGLGYFWDDFYFLSFNGHGDVWANLLPDAHATFYRPISLGVYFKVLRFLDPANGVLGHVLNLAALVGVVILLVLLVSRLCGPRAGLFSGLIFASYGHVSGLVAWVSCSQDLLAILFVIAAFLLRHRGRDVAALACATVALLCKEPAIAAFPVLVFWDWLVGRAAKRPKLQLAGYAAVALAWAAFHPGIHQLLDRGRSTIGYVGVQDSARFGPYLARYLMTLFNLPPLGVRAPWWDDRAVYGFAALLVLVVGLWSLDRNRRGGGFGESLSLARVGLIGTLFMLPSLLMPAVLVRHWSPYFACIPALGMAMFLGPALARQNRLIALFALSTFLVLGIWCRGVRSEREWILSEPAMVEASSAVREVRANVRRLFPSFPKGSQVVVSFGTRGIRGIQSALVDGQALGLWYRDPTLRTVMTRDRRPGAPAEFLLRITNDLDVIAIDPDSLGVRSASGASPDLSEIDQPVNNFARAVAAGGDTDRAIRIQEGLNRVETGDLLIYNRRMIASFLLAAGRRREADSVLAATPPLPPDVALTLVVRLLADASASERLDSAAFEAFGLSSSDPTTLRRVIRELLKNGWIAQAAWFASTLKQIVPEDAESAELLARAAQMGVEPRREPAPRLAAPGVEGGL